MKKIITSFIFCLWAFASFGQWKTINTGTDNIINDIFMVDAKIAYAVGDSILLKTTDGGDNWTDLTSKITFTYPAFSTVFFVDATTGYIGRTNITGDPTLLKTTDGGQSWVNVSSSKMSHGPTKLFFTSATNGYSTGGIGAGNFFTSTTSGGLSWNQVSTPSLDASSALFFISPQVGFSGTAGIMKTTNGGASWESTNMPLDKDNPITDITFLNSQTGYALTYNLSKVYKTSDGGNNWTAQNTWVKGAMAQDIVFTDANTGYIAAIFAERPVVTSDGGTNWQNDGTFPANKKLACAAAKNGVVMVGTMKGEIIIKKTATTSVQTPTQRAYTLYPNPVTTGSVNIDNPASEPLQVTVYNIVGQEVAKYEDVQSGFLVNLAPALYHCQIVDAQGNTSFVKLTVN